MAVEQAQVEEEEGEDAQVDEIFNMIRREMKKGDYLIIFSVSQLSFSQVIFHQLLEAVEKRKCYLLSVHPLLDSRDDRQNTDMGYYAFSTHWFFGEIKFIEDAIEDRSDKNKSLEDQSIARLRVMFRENDLSIGVSEKEINDLSREDLIAMLS
jgi:hypothetical protein